jgi:hypothetical protein
VPQYFPDVTKEAGTGPNETSVGKPIASRSAVFASADGRKKVTLSVDQYGSASDAAAAYQMAVQGSIAAPGFESATSPSLGQEALGTRDGRLIMSATHAGDILVDRRCILIGERREAAIRETRRGTSTCPVWVVTEVRFIPESGHARRKDPCLLSAKSGTRIA